MTEIDFTEHAPNYEKYLEKSDLKSNTVEKRKTCINEFIEHCNKYQVTIETDNFYDAVDEIKNYFERDDINVHGTKVSAVRHFIDYISRQVDSRTEDQLQDIREKIKMAKLTDNAKEIGQADPKEREGKLLSDEEIQKAKDATDFHGRLLIDLMLDTAARPGEVVAMTPEDVDFEKGSFHINSTWSDAEGFVQHSPKHDGFRKVKISSDTLERLKQYVDENDVSEDDLVFGSYRRGVYEPIKEAFTHAQVRVDEASDSRTDVTPHWLRHNAATRLIQNGNRKEKVQEYLGHNQMSTTEIYEHFDDSEVVDVELE